MKTTAGLLIMVLLATVVAHSTSTTTTAARETASIPASPGGGLGGFFFAKRGGLWVVSEKHGKVMAGGGDRHMNVDSDVMAGPESARERKKFVVKDYKVCAVPGPCYKKKLVCPKKCSSSSSGRGPAGRVEKKHFTGSCVLDCNKCIAHC